MTGKNLHYHVLRHFAWAELHKMQDHGVTANDCLISQKNIRALPLKTAAAPTALPFGLCILLLLQEENSLCKRPQRTQPEVQLAIIRASKVHVH